MNSYCPIQNSTRVYMDFFSLKIDTECLEPTFRIFFFMIDWWIRLNTISQTKEMTERPAVVMFKYKHFCTKEFKFGLLYCALRHKHRDAFQTFDRTSLIVSRGKTNLHMPPGSQLPTMPQQRPEDTLCLLAVMMSHYK